jgi:hypothetical protein
MKYFLIITLWLVSLMACSTIKNKTPQTPETMKNLHLENKTGSIGAFSMSLSVKDLKVSKAYYENLGFTQKGGDMKMNYVVMKNGNALIGLFQGMFEGNILTFNPGWDERGNNLDEFTDIRNLYKNLKSKGVVFDKDVEESASGPASFMMTDPDGNLILVDQHR